MKKGFTTEKATAGNNAWGIDVPVEVSVDVNQGEPDFFIPEVINVPTGSPTMLDLFCGAGGFSIGAAMAGITPVFGLDYLAPAIATWRKNHPNAISCLGDIRKTDLHAVKQMLADKGVQHINVLTGGVPCQGFSRANRKHNPDDSRNFLFMEYMRYVEAFQPDYSVIENVGGLRTTGNGKFEREIKQHMGQLSYNVTIKLVNAADYGVPQQRNRLFFVGVKQGRGLNEFYEFPDGGFYPETYRTVADAISDLQGLGLNETKTDYVTSPKNDYKTLMRGDSTVLLNHQAPNHTSEVVEMIRNTAPGQPMYANFKQRTRLDSSKPSPTLLAGGIRPQFQFGHSI